MRELLTVFSGNEMIFGIILGNWLLLTGLGSYLGKTVSKLKNPLAVLIAAQVAVAVLPIADVFALRTLRNVVFIRGAAIGVTETVISCFILLMPYCLIAGYLLTLACSVLASKEGPASIGEVYFLDSIGDIAGGFLFSFVLIYLFDHFGILYFPAFLNLLFAAGAAFLLGRKILSALAAVTFVALLTVVLLVDLDSVSAKIQYAGQKVVYKGNSPYGSLVVTEQAGQYNFIHNGVPLFSTHNIGQVEETVHYAMCQRPQAETVLLIAGGISGTAREILKYGVPQVDYVELDPLIIDVGRKYLGHDMGAAVNVIATDGRLFVKRARKQYDVVIADVPDPSTSQLNRFYTYEFFTEAKRVLTDDGVLALSLGHYENYVSPELANLIGVAHRTLKQVFKNVLIIPGGQVFFLASDGQLYPDIAGRLEGIGMQLQLVNRSYLRGMLTPERIADMRRCISQDTPVNRDFNPVLYYYHLRHWISRFKVRFGAMQVVLLGVLAVYLLRLRAIPFAIFTTGFAAATLEIVLLVGFQILYGYVYHKVGLIVTMFMAGLAFGSFAMNRMLSRRGRSDLVKLELSVAAYAAALPFVMMGLAKIASPTASAISAQVMFPVLTFVLAVIVGMEFPLAGKAAFADVTTTAAQLYTADFIGACLGSLIVSTLLIPLIGVVAVCLITAALNLAGALAVLLSRR